ncbi:MAG: type II toxin-antitoxin system RatA family toxin [Alphaproteobacteria bacterium]|nr:type II toxin-antitoxin system RatA family toxin [Alphaproteobacteria bacterium]
MPSHHETQTLPYTPRQLFALVADVEAYPQFLPWCSAVRILERGENSFLAELSINFKGFPGNYVSRVTLHPPEEEMGLCAIEVVAVRGPFTHLSNRWRFSPLEGGGACVDFALDFSFRSGLLERMIGPLFARATGTMVKAFKERAERLYGAAG